MLGKRTTGRRRIQLIDDLLEKKNYTDLKKSVKKSIKFLMWPSSSTHHMCPALTPASKLVFDLHTLVGSKAELT